MTAQSAVEETAAERVARRIRGLMAEQRISGSEVARRIGMDQRAFSRRHRGETDWTFDEAERIGNVLGWSLEELVRQQGLEPRTRCFPAAPDLKLVKLPRPVRPPAAVAPVPQQRPPSPESRQRHLSSVPTRSAQ